MKYKHALVTGGAGFIGSHISKMLLDKGIAVTVLDNLSLGVIENIPAEARFIKGDILDAPLLNKLTKDCDIIFHEAARVSIRSSLDNFVDDASTNLMGTLFLLNACRNSNIKKFIFASSMAVYADSPEDKPINENFSQEPLSPYGISKLAAEKYVHMMCSQNGIDSIVLRYFNTFGPGQTYTPYVGVITIFIKKLLAGESPVIFGDGEQLRDFVYVGDIASANICAMESDATGITMNIGTGRATSVNRIAELLINKINKDITASKGDEVFGELKISYPDISLAGKKIGYKPKYKIEDKIDEVIEYIRQGFLKS